MARSAEIEKPQEFDPSDYADEDMSRIKELLGATEKREFIRRPRMPEPSEQPWQHLLDSFMTRIEANSPTEEDFSENLRRTFEAFQKAGFDVQDVDSLIAKEVERYRAARGEGSAPPTSMQQNRRDELQKYQDEFKGNYK